MEKLKNNAMTLWQKIGYGLGDIYGGGAGIIISFYYLYFLTDIIHLRPALAGLVILISKGYDAITDPFEGLISDRTRTKLGRRRPYLLAGIPLVFISFFLLFYPVSLEQEYARLIFVICTYLFYSTIVSIVMLNYNALQSELTSDYNERTQLSSLRIFFSAFSSLICAVVPLEIVDMVADVRQGYILMGIIFGLFFALPFIATFFSTKERKEFQKEPGKFDLKSAFIEPFKVKTFVHTLFMYLFAFIAMDVVSSILIYFMTYYLGRGSEANFVAGALLIAQVVILPFYVWYSKKYSKRAGYMLAAGIWSGLMLTSFFLGPNNPGFVIYVFASLVGFGTGGVVVMIYAIFPDIPDVDELRSGERREGIFSAMIGFMRKLSSAITLFLVSQIIDWTGYIAPVEEIVNGVVTMVEQAQPQSFIIGLRAIFILIPILFLLAGLFFASKNKLTRDHYQTLQQLLEKKRRDDPLTESEIELEQELYHALID